MIDLFKNSIDISIKDFPKKLTINEEIFGTIQLMRQATKKDSNERWAYVGIKNDKLVVSKLYKGTNNQVPTSKRFTLLQEAENNGIKVIGDIHTHPADILSKIVTKILHIKVYHGFSIEDLNGFLHSETENKFMFLVEANKILLIFKTREFKNKDWQIKSNWANKLYGIRITQEFSKRFHLALYESENEEYLMRVL